MRISVKDFIQLLNDIRGFEIQDRHDLNQKLKVLKPRIQFQEDDDIIPVTQVDSILRFLNQKT